MFQQTIIPEQKALQIICSRCEYTWPSTAALKRQFVQCPQCKTTITIRPRRKRSSKMNQYSFFDNLSEKAKVEYKDAKIFDISVMTSKAGTRNPLVEIRCKCMLTIYH